MAAVLLLLVVVLLAIQTRITVAFGFRLRCRLPRAHSLLIISLVTHILESNLLIEPAPVIGVGVLSWHILLVAFLIMIA